MIFYFSGTGNSKHVAQQLALATGESCISITDCMSKDECSFSLSKDERVGFVTPVYFWGLPDIVVRFVNKLTLTALHHNFIYHVLTFGTTTGQAHYMMQELLKKKGLRLDAKYNVRMVDVWTPIFDVSDHEKCLRKRKTPKRALPRPRQGPWHARQATLIICVFRIGLPIGTISHTGTSARRRISM